MVAEICDVAIAVEQIDVPEIAWNQDPYNISQIEILYISILLHTRASTINRRLELLLVSLPAASTRAAITARENVNKATSSIIRHLFCLADVFPTWDPSEIAR